MAEENWHQARLIPTSGINGAEEQERRATSALLAVMSSVREYGQVLTKPLGAPSGNVEAYIEVPFTLGEQRLYPDGLIRVQRGKRSWTALIEVKTGNNDLDVHQLENYLTIAKEHGFDALITISNQIPAIPGQHPTNVDRRKLRGVRLHHWSWSLVLAEAVLQKEHRGVADPDQAWILGELIRYLEHPRSGALKFDDMGPAWVPVRQAVSSGTLRTSDKSAPEVASRFDALIRYVSLQLGRRLGDEVTPSLSRKELSAPDSRTQSVVASLCSDGIMQGGIRIPHAVAPLMVTVDLRANQIICYVDVDAPRNGRMATRVNWLVRQLKQGSDSLRIEAFTKGSRGPGATELLKAVRDNPNLLVPDAAKEIRSFRVAMSTPLGTKRGTGRGSFIDSVIDGVDTFYTEVLQHLKTWTASPPTMRVLSPEEIEQSNIASTALSSQDGTEAPSKPGIDELDVSAPTASTKVEVSGPTP